MRVDAHVPGSARQTFVFSVGDVLVGDGIDVLFRQTEIYTRSKRNDIFHRLTSKPWLTGKQTQKWALASLSFTTGSSPAVCARTHKAIIQKPYRY